LAVYSGIGSALVALNAATDALARSLSSALFFFFNREILLVGLLMSVVPLDVVK
jgi:hypothetical protein